MLALSFLLLTVACGHSFAFESAFAEMRDSADMDELAASVVPSVFIRVIYQLDSRNSACSGKISLEVDDAVHAVIENTSVEFDAVGEIDSLPVGIGRRSISLKLHNKDGQVCSKFVGVLAVNCCLPAEEYTKFEHLKRASKVQESGSGFEFGKDVFMGNVPYWTKYLGMHGLLDPLRRVDYLEVGTWEGQSAVWTALAALTNPASTLTCIDIMKEFYLQRWQNNSLNLNMGERVRFLNRDSFQVLSMLLDEGKRAAYDVVYIDAAHDSRSTLANTLMAWPLVKEGGLMIWDDYGLDGENGPQKAVDAFWSAFADQFSVLKRPTWENWQPIVRKKISVKLASSPL